MNLSLKECGPIEKAERKPSRSLCRRQGKGVTIDPVHLRRRVNRIGIVLAWLNEEAHRSQELVLRELGGSGKRWWFLR